MLDYSVDLEILSDLYNEYREHSGDSKETLHRLGRSYIPYIEEYALDEKTAYAIHLLAEFADSEELDTARKKLMKADLDRKIAVRREQEEYNSFCMQFSGETRRALLKIPKYLFGRKVPYRVRDRSLHFVIADHASMSLDIDFDNVLIEDGRNPLEIEIRRFTAENITQQRRIRSADGTEQMTEMPAYRFSFINGLGNRKYPVRVNSFSCTDISGRLELYDYTAYPGQLDADPDKIAYRRLYYILDSFIFKMKCLGIGSLNKKEISILPLVKVFYELIGLYLDPGTVSAAGMSQVSFDIKKAASAISVSSDIDAACRLLMPHGFKRLIAQLEKADEDRIAFCRFWVYYASTRHSAHLYRFLVEQLSSASTDYRMHPLPLSYRKFHSLIRKLLDEELIKNGWSGTFPCYYMEAVPKFIELANIYSKKYTYVNEKKKSYYVDFMESVSGVSYTVMALRGEILLRDGEEASDFCALDGCFNDGGRRRNAMSECLTMSGHDDEKQILDAAAAMAARITIALRG